MEYTFHVYNQQAADGVAIATDKLLRADLTKRLTPRKF